MAEILADEPTAEGLELPAGCGLDLVSDMGVTASMVSAFPPSWVTAR